VGLGNWPHFFGGKMKKYFIPTIAFVMIGGVAFGGITTSQKYRLNRLNKVASDVQLGTLIENAEGYGTMSLTRGYVLKGSSAGVAETLDANDSGKILVGDGTDLASVAVSGDITLSSAGAVAIADKAVQADDVELAEGSVVVGYTGGGGSALDAKGNGKILIGNGTTITSQSVSGDVTLSNAGAVSIGAGKVLESMLVVPGTDGLNAKRIARATYDVAVDGGSAYAYNLGVALPAKALITESYFYIVTQFADSGSGTVALHCEDADNILAATDLTGEVAGTLIKGVSDGASANVKLVDNACNLTATVASATQSAGKLILFVEYVLAE